LQIKEAQKDDDELWAIVQNVEDGKHTDFSVDDDGVMWFEDRLCVPSDQALPEKVMTKAHSSPFTVHPGSTKMYRDLKQYFWWNGMKQDVATKSLDCMALRLLLCPTEIQGLRLVFGRDYRKPEELGKSYADKHRRDLEFQVRDRVLLKVSPFRGVKHFGIKGKLSPRF
nr:retrotransposon protein, putative, Ty3-gypsy subclass [Tanacetum cinerariifolium]